MSLALTALKKVFADVVFLGVLLRISAQASLMSVPIAVAPTDVTLVQLPAQVDRRLRVPPTVLLLSAADRHEVELTLQVN